jgi:pyruvate ferredoxin oxidoreductase delta subunit
LSRDPEEILYPIAKPSKGSSGPTWMWRFTKPIIILDKCTKCGLCWVYCPEATIHIKPDGFPEVDYDYCKGCGICDNVCPSDAIDMVSEYGD